MTVKELFRWISKTNHYRKHINEEQYTVNILFKNSSTIWKSTKTYKEFVKIIKDNFESSERKAILVSKFILGKDDNTYILCDFTKDPVKPMLTISIGTETQIPPLMGDKDQKTAKPLLKSVLTDTTPGIIRVTTSKENKK